MCFMAIDKFYYFLNIFVFMKNQISIRCLPLMPKESSLKIKKNKKKNLVFKWINSSHLCQKISLFLSFWKVFSECRRFIIILKKTSLFSRHELYLMGHLSSLVELKIFNLNFWFWYTLLRILFSWGFIGHSGSVCLCFSSAS